MNNGKYYDLLLKEEHALELALAAAKADLENYEVHYREMQADLKSGLTAEHLESLGLLEFANSPTPAKPDLWALETSIGRFVPFHPEFEEGFKGLFKGYTLTNLVSQLSRSVGSWEYKYPTLFSVRDGGGQYLLDILTAAAHDGSLPESPTTQRAVEWIQSEIAEQNSISSGSAVPQEPLAPQRKSSAVVDDMGGLLYNNYTAQDLDQLLFDIGLLTDLQSLTPTAEARGSVWVAVAEGLRRRKRLKLGNRLAVLRAFTARYGTEICSASTFGRAYNDAVTRAAEILSSIEARLAQP
ncbi:hypothetical protein E5K00_06030 [Hymenobacter aquaticus]|uniref:Uncharacterized protein n=1 Tax=Hymenobacter aquaticus TaxID=1867101 RepID=A0A4Z0Q6J4_9BACT|nr:hypothetical protein [Hymenobacter aquaticus]TGE24763.1 hypothetical protein E5K00_06030 [Hymenobacter aquaticus]